jgi:hypothetical protein
MIEQEIEPAPKQEMVQFLKDGATFGYDVRPGFYAKVYDRDLEYLAAVGVINWKAKRPPLNTRSVLVLKGKKRR